MILTHLKLYTLQYAIVNEGDTSVYIKNKGKAIVIPNDVGDVSVQTPGRTTHSS